MTATFAMIFLPPPLAGDRQEDKATRLHGQPRVPPATLLAASSLSPLFSGERISTLVWNNTQKLALPCGKMHCKATDYNLSLGLCLCLISDDRLDDAKLFICDLQWFGVR